MQFNRQSAPVRLFGLRLCFAVSIGGLPLGIGLMNARAPNRFVGYFHNYGDVTKYQRGLQFDGSDPKTGAKNSDIGAVAARIDGQKIIVSDRLKS